MQCTVPKDGVSTVTCYLRQVVVTVISSQPSNKPWSGTTEPWALTNKNKWRLSQDLSEICGLLRVSNLGYAWLSHKPELRLYFEMKRLLSFLFCLGGSCPYRCVSQYADFRFHFSDFFTFCTVSRSCLLQKITIHYKIKRK